MTYTTEQLIQFLDTEFTAHAKGDREFVLPDGAEEKAKASNDPMTAILGARNMASVDSYHSYRDQVHAYQLKHQVSGIVVQTKLMPDGSVVRFPTQHYQLTLVPGDINTLRAAKDRVLEAFTKCVRAGFYYLAHRVESRNGLYWDMETTLEYIASFAEYMDWAAFSNCDDPGEVSLSLGYGSPVDGDYVYNREAESWNFYAQSFCRNLGVDAA